MNLPDKHKYDRLNDLFCGIYIKDCKYLENFFKENPLFDINHSDHVFSIINTLLNDFNIEVANLLINKGLKIPDNFSFLNTPIYKNNTTSLEWLINNNKSLKEQLKIHINKYLTKAFNNENEDIILFLVNHFKDSIRKNKNNIYKHPVIHYELFKSLIQKSLKDNNSLLFSVTTRFYNEYNHFKMWMIYPTQKMSLNDYKRFMSFIRSNEDITKKWNNAFPLTINSNSIYSATMNSNKGYYSDNLYGLNKEIIVKEPFEAFVINGSKMIREILKNNHKNKEISEILKKDNFLEAFFYKSTVVNIKAIIKPCYEYFKNWKDEKGNTLFHYLFSRSCSMSMVDFVVSLDKENCFSKNKQGLKPKDLLNHKNKSYFKKRIIEKQLPKNKKRTKKNKKLKRKM